MSNNNIGYAEAQALKRREHILKLRKKVEEKSEDAENKNPDSQSSNYHSNDRPQNDPIEPQEIKERLVKDSILSEELDLNQLAPRKINWDLKRGIERKLEILQEATNNAIAELIRDDKVDDVLLQGFSHVLTQQQNNRRFPIYSQKLHKGFPLSYYSASLRFPY